MSIETTKRSKLKMAGGAQVDVITLETGRYKATKFINMALPDRAWCVYLCDAPHANLDGFIEDTKIGGIRSMETILQASNVLTVQRKRFSVEADFSDASTIPALVDHYSPAAMAVDCIDAVNSLLPDTDYGLLAQGNGFSVLLWILTKIDKLKNHPEYVYLSSPIPEPDNAFALLNHRRSRVLTRNQQLKALLDQNPVTALLKRKLNDQANGETKIHKLAKSIAHPSHPIGLIGINVEKEIEYLASLDTENRSQKFAYAAPDPTDFIMDSHYLTPGSNLAKVKKELIASMPYDAWMMDEFRFDCDEYSATCALENLTDYNAATRLFPQDWLRTLTHYAKEIPTHIAFDPTDIAVPFADYTGEFLTTMDDFAVLHEREGYGHWVGHSLIRRVSGRLAA